MPVQSWCTNILAADLQESGRLLCGPMRLRASASTLLGMKTSTGGMSQSTCTTRAQLPVSCAHAFLACTSQHAHRPQLAPLEMLF